MCLLVTAATTTLYGCTNLATIDAPLTGQEYGYEPIEIFVRLVPDANPGTFEALLNSNDISDRFVFNADLNVMKARVGFSDGLVLGTNSLTTKIEPEGGGFPDSDSREFLVKEGNVVTTRDDKGVWFITGPNDADFYDIFEAQGYAVATDRLFQLETFRRQARGELAEVWGASYFTADMLTSDIYTRTVGYSDDELQAHFDGLDPRYQAIIQGYVAGINRRIHDLRNNPSHQPFEIFELGVKWLIQRDYTVLDLVSWIIQTQRNIVGPTLPHQQITDAALFQELLEKFPDDYVDMIEDFRWINDPDALTVIPGSGSMVSASTGISGHSLSGTAVLGFPDLRGVAARMTEIRRAVIESLEALNAYVKMGSYAWVVSGAKTSSGNPIIYSGPQQDIISAPSVSLEGSIRAGGFDVSGMTYAGIPGIVIGSTPHHAWAFETGHATAQDYYIEDLTDVFLHRTETIKVRNQPDVSLPVYRTAHGPVISPMPFDPATYDLDSDGPIISWKSAVWDHEIDAVEGMFRFGTATNIDEFAEGIEYIPSSRHVFYADRDGNIAYWMSGREPVRPPGEWRFPQGFLGPPLEWDSETLVDRPTDRNTTQGFYSGWNTKCSSDYVTIKPPLMSFGPFDRVHVIHEYLSTHNNLTFEDVRDLALNIGATHSFGGGGNPWPFVETHFSAVVNANSTPERAAALDLMASWDGHYVDGGEPAWAWGTDVADAWVLMYAWILRVLHLTFYDEYAELNAPEAETAKRCFDVLLHGLPGATMINRYNWFQNLSNSTEPQTADEIILVALDRVLAELGPRPWGTGDRPTIPFRHAMWRVGQLGVVHRIPFSSRSTYSQCVEYGSTGPVRIESMFPLGQSGTIYRGSGLFGSPVLDPHFLSMTDVYDGFAHRAFPLFD